MATPITFQAIIHVAGGVLYALELESTLTGWDALCAYTPEPGAPVHPCFVPNDSVRWIEYPTIGTLAEDDAIEPEDRA